MKYDLTGRRFGKLFVSGRGFREKTKTIELAGKCDCGVEKVVPSGSLRSGKVKSCGCAKTSNRRKDITGEVYGRLTITGFHSMASNRVSKWNAKCSCGKEVVVRKSNLWIDKDGAKNTVSCGCHRVDTQRIRHTTHGEYLFKNRKASKEYACWQNMLQRCENDKHPSHKSYGAKGVTVCKDWHTFENFLSDVGRAPEDKPCIDRIDPYGNYEKGNIRWVDKHTSDTNKR